MIPVQSKSHPFPWDQLYPGLAFFFLVQAVPAPWQSQVVLPYLREQVIAHPADLLKIQMVE